jgi:hypothetical protein
VTDDDYVELTGDDLPYHLRLDAPPLATCSRCLRMTWSEEVLDGDVDLMRQPDGRPCMGVFRRP